MSQMYDVAIIGGGPAGSACALALQGSGLRVALIDKEPFPRDKVCGDNIPGPSFKAMNAINAQWAKALRAFADKEDVRTFKAYGPNGRPISFNWKSYSCNSKRFDFDNFLMRLVREETETVIIENNRLQQVVREAGGIACKLSDGTSFSASVIIGCDGANAVTTRQLGSFDLRHTDSCAAVRSYYRNVSGIESGVNEVYYIKELHPGYFWLFPLENGWVNVGLGVLNDKKQKPVNLRNALQKITSAHPVIAERFKNATLMDEARGFALPLGTKKMPISGERFMLCGDAASLIDPLGGHGISNAMWSGYFAAQQAIASHKQQNFTADFMKQYDIAVYEKLGSDLSKNTMLLKLSMRFPFLVNMFFWAGQKMKLAQWLKRAFKF